MTKKMVRCNNWDKEDCKGKSCQHWDWHERNEDCEKSESGQPPVRICIVWGKINPFDGQEESMQCNCLTTEEAEEQENELREFMAEQLEKRKERRLPILKEEAESYGYELVKKE